MRKAFSGPSIVLTFFCLWAIPAVAQSQQLLGGARPWAQSISAQQQQAARELFNAGNDLLTESNVLGATEKYQNALRLWNHPAIHYNLALALMKQDKPVEVYEHLVSAMRYGPEPLGADKYESAGRYKDLVDTQIVRLSISCDEPGATVTLDGQTLFVGPGRYQGLVRHGAHSILAMKEGYVTADKTQALMPGQVSISLRPYQLEYRRQWPSWMPWAVMGTGVVVAAGGGLLQLQTRNNYDLFDAGIKECGGCDPKPLGLADARVRGDNIQRAAFGAYGLGGVALVTGAVLLYLNQPQLIHEEASVSAERVDVTPLLGGTNGVLATFRF